MDSASYELTRRATVDGERLFLRAVELNTQTRGASDPRTLTSIQHLGEAYRREGRLPEAEKEFQRAIAGLTAVASQPKALSAALSGLGTLYCDEGRLDEAEATLSKALSVGMAEGDQEPVVADGMLELATTFRENGKTDRAMPLLKKAERIYRLDRDPRLALALHGIGLVQFLEGRKAWRRIRWWRREAWSRRLRGAFADRCTDRH